MQTVDFTEFSLDRYVNEWRLDMVFLPSFNELHTGLSFSTSRSV